MTENTTKEDIAQEENPTKTNNTGKEATATTMTTAIIGKMTDETTIETTKKMTEESTIVIIIMRTNMIKTTTIETNPEELNGKRTTNLTTKLIINSIPATPLNIKPIQLRFP